MTALARSIDWGKTSLGSIAAWPAALRSAASLALGSRFPTLVAWGPELVVVHNDAFRPLLGERAPALGRAFDEVWGDLAPVLRPPLDAVLATGEGRWAEDVPHVVERGGAPDEGYFSASYAPIRDDAGRVAGVFVTFAETTERVLARRRLQAIAQRDSEMYRFFLEAPIPICVLRGPELVFEVANRMYLELVSGRPIVGKTFAAALPEVADLRVDERSVVETLRAVMAEKRIMSGQNRPVPIRRKSGPIEQRYFTFVYAPLTDADGRADRVMVVAMDVTGQAVAMHDLARARGEAERASAVKDEFLAMLGHELRNPLAPILTALEILTVRGDRSIARERAIIDRQVRHLVRLVDDLLDVSRITRGKIELDRARVDLADAVADAIETASPLLEQRAHVLRVAVPKDRLFVCADRARLAQVLANLMTNAAKYTEPHGTIDVAASADGGDVVVSVEDNGMGMPPELVPRVFDLFEQGTRTIDRAAGGLGLGLAIVKSLTAMHGGTVTASSEGPGKGSEFTVRLPAFTEADDAIARSARADAPRFEGTRPDGASRRILIVDDNEDGADLLDLALQTMGHTTCVAHDGPEALLKAQDFEPDVALIDIGLPVMDGYEVAVRLRQMFDGHCPKLIAVTGYGQESDRRRAREAGFDRHMVKPIELAHLAELLVAPG